ncbi:hypothetical protein ABIE37_001253 [Arthrobacter bambusae]|uniref:EVE domain-containing protein n=1 Tax=Arthrobacter bambusae TaxID=1338426 RepID=A0ABV2P418_9MICC
MRYWWASQGKNYPIAIEQGSLWSCPGGRGELRGDRILLKELKLGDAVFHYYGPHLRAVSVVADEWKEAARPDGYPPREGEGDDGWLVQVTPFATGLEIPWTRIAELITHGSPGPFTAVGKPQQKFLSALPENEALAVLREAGVSLQAPQEESFLGLPEDCWGDGETDAQALTTVRKEQGELRRHLLHGRSSAPCSICGEELPAKVLVAGHIKPRSLCSEDERWDFRSAAMLICALGCDALFEWGYVVVDDSGRVRRGRHAETKDLEAAVDLLIGKVCSAHNEHTASNFAERRRIVSPSIVDGSILQ